MKPGAQIIVKLNRGVQSEKPVTKTLSIPESSSISETLVSVQSEPSPPVVAPSSVVNSVPKFAALSLGWAPHGGIELRNGIKIVRVVPSNYLQGKTFDEQMAVMEKALAKR